MIIYFSLEKEVVFMLKTDERLVNISNEGKIIKIKKNKYFGFFT